MERSKLVSILKTFTKEEFRGLGKFVASPYFSTGRDCTAMYESLKPCYPEFTGRIVSKRSVYERMYPGKKYSGAKADSLLATLGTELYKLALEFLRYSQLEKDEAQKKLLLLKGLRGKSLYREFEKEYSRAENENDITRGSSEGFLERHRLNSLYSDYAWDRGLAEKMCYARLDSTTDALGFGIITAFKYMDLRNSAKYLDINLPRSFTDIVLESLDGEKMLSSMRNENSYMYPFISANYFIYMMNRFPDEKKYYDSLKETLYSNIEKFGHTEKYLLHQALETHITIAIEHKGFSEAAARELFELYKNSLRLGVYKISPDGYLEPTVYRNIFITACDVKEFEWAEKFINEYYAELQEDFAEGMRDYALALVYFNEGEYTKAQEKIVNISYDYALHKIDAKILHFKICYELGQIEQSYNLLDTAKHYLSSANVPGIYRRQNVNFIKFAAELLKLSAGRGKDTGFVINKLKDAEPVRSKAWLMQKLESLF